ncbi:MAG: cobalamin B12-binding domain-containing protein [Nitrospinae bacterium]|nr:cobalamin B12-binding domain-containing protein [Nitrospinota bacterium]
MAAKILFVAPPTNATKQLTPDLGIGFLASALRGAGFDVDFIDVRRDGFSRAGFIERLRREPYLFVGVKVFSTSLPEANEVLNAVREALPQTKIIIGGPHPTYAPEDALKSCPAADVGIIGEGDTAVIALARAFAEGKSVADIEAIAFRDGGVIRVNARKSFLDLERLPLPAWDLIDPRRYVGHEDLWFFSKGKVTAPISVGRGCPFKCTFCSDFIVAGRNVRYRPVEKVMDEIALLVNEYGVDEIHLTDSIFTINKKYVYSFCENLQKRNLKIHWATPYGTRLDTLDAELLGAMEQAGCYGTSVGIEAGSDQMLAFMKKGVTVALVEEKIKLIKANTRWLVQGFFILGYPTETRETMRATIDLACRLPLDMAVFAPFRATPGTEVAAYLAEHEPEFTPAWGNQSVEHLVYHPRGIGVEEMERWHRRAYRAFYFRPHVAWRYLTMIRGKKEMRLLAAKFKNRIFRRASTEGNAAAPPVWAS